MTTAGLLSPPCSRRSSKQKRPPPITPKRFSRFFTPRSSVSTHSTTSRSARQLRDITRAAVNRSSATRYKRKTSATFGKENVPQDSLVTPDSTPRKRKAFQHVASSPMAASSPCKRLRRHSKTPLPDITSSPPQLPVVAENEVIDTIALPEVTFCPPIRRITRSSMTIRAVERSFGNGHARRHRDEPGWIDPQTKTSGFYSTARDSSKFPTGHLPFCTAACNTNSLVAAGTESGGVWLIDPSKPDMIGNILKFWPHANAIMDMQFSSDDMTLATCGGDQTARLVDMPTQTTKAVFKLHTSSLKQVRFQPGDENIIATCCRDGVVALWDVRCRGTAYPVSRIVVDPSCGDQQMTEHKALLYTDPLHAIYKAHLDRHSAQVPSCARDNERGGHSRSSVTSLSFISAERNHLLVTASEVSSALKVWDIRSRYSRSSSTTSIPVSTTAVPRAHQKARNYGTTSLAINSDCSRLYALSWDSTLYAYSTSHLVLGQAPELRPTKMQNSRFFSDERPALGPLYGFKHPKLRVSSFFVKCALRRASSDKPELIATGSGNKCPILFSTDERDFPEPILSATGGCPIYEFGTALIRGHETEQSTLAWTSDGSLITASDDFTVRCWRDDARVARNYRETDRQPGSSLAVHRAGWAEVGEGFDDEDE